MFRVNSICDVLFDFTLANNITTHRKKKLSHNHIKLSHPDWLHRIPQSTYALAYATSPLLLATIRLSLDSRTHQTTVIKTSLSKRKPTWRYILRTRLHTNSPVYARVKQNPYRPGIAGNFIAARDEVESCAYLHTQRLEAALGDIDYVCGLLRKEALAHVCGRVVGEGHAPR